MNKPSTSDVRSYLDRVNPLGLRNAKLDLVNAHNHIIYRVEQNDGSVYVLRMINPESYRAGEWVNMNEEFRILKVLELRGLELGPRVYFLDEDKFSIPILIQDFVEATCFNDLKPLSRQHLEGAARAVATLNTASIDQSNLHFLKKYTKESFEKSGFAWKVRLLDSFRRAPKKDVFEWVRKIWPLTSQARKYLRWYEGLFAATSWSFHFDGAHTGNTYWRDGKVLFLDWQKVSYRNDPTFTLVRFMTSADTEPGKVSEEMFDILVRRYLQVNPRPDFREMARARLLERQVSDLVWVLWNYSRKEDKRPIEEATSIVPRYEEVKRKLSH